jgi:hypothetical protein
MTLDALSSLPIGLNTDPAARKVAAPLAQTDSFAELFSSGVSAAPLSSPAAPLPKFDPPTYEQGATVTGPDGTTTALNSTEMATTQTAAQIAAMLGGTVSGESFGGGYSTSAAFRDITFANSNVKINAGLAASLFATYGTAPGSQAWRIINNDLGRDPMATGPVS